MPFINEAFWNEKNKKRIANGMIELAQRVIPDIKQYIIERIIATPLTLFKWSLNYKGACYGWADTILQFGDPDFSETSRIANLFLTGYWSTKSGGITSVINSAYITAKKIIALHKRVKSKVCSIS